MKSYVEFCRHYELDPDRSESKQQYQAYRENLAALLAAARPSVENSPPGHPAD